MRTIRLVLYTLSFTLLFGCGGSHSPRMVTPQLTPFRLTVSVPHRQGLPSVTKVIVKVTGDEIDGALVFELPYNHETHTASGTIQVPNGQDRYFLIQALDANGKPVCEGKAGPIDIDPISNAPITVELWPSEERFGVATFSFNLLDAIPNAYRGIGRIRVCYSPFRDGQSPDSGIYPSEAQMREDLTLLKPLVIAVRSYGVTHGLEKIPAIAKELGIQCLAGAWIGRNASENQKELGNLVAIAQKGQAEKIAVGSEVLLRGDITKDELVALIRQVKQQVSVPVSTGEIYQIWLDNPDLVEVCDYLLVHIFPYWEGFPFEHALERVQAVYGKLRSAYPNKPIVLGEIGWPSEGQTYGQAKPDPVNQRRFVRQVVEWANTEGIEVYLFEAFDEKWKTTHEGAVGAHWGLLMSDRMVKPEIRKIWF